MSEKQNKAIVCGYMEEVLNKRDLAVFGHYFSEDVVFNGEKGFRQQLENMYSHTSPVFPDLQLTIEDQIAEGDRVVTRVTFRGTHQGEFHGIPPSGNLVVWTGVAMDRLANGKVIEMWHWSDDMGMLRQLGVITIEPRTNQSIDH